MESCRGTWRSEKCSSVSWHLISFQRVAKGSVAPDKECSAYGFEKVDKGHQRTSELILRAQWGTGDCDVAQGPSVMGGSQPGRSTQYFCLPLWVLLCRPGKQVNYLMSKEEVKAHPSEQEQRGGSIKRSWRGYRIPLGVWSYRAWCKSRYQKIKRCYNTYETAWALNQVSSCDVSAPVGGLDGGRERMLEQL